MGGEQGSKEYVASIVAARVFDVLNEPPTERKAAICTDYC